MDFFILIRIFENLPVLDDLGAKLSEIYGSKTGGEGSKSGNSATSKQSQLTGGMEQQAQKHGTANRFTKSIDQQEPQSTEGGKWKMMFPKDDDFSASTSASGKDSVNRPSAQSDKIAVNLKPNIHQQPSVFNRLDNAMKPGQVQQHHLQEQAKRTPVGVFGRALQQTQNQAAPPVKQGPVVLDKFGNFR